MHARSGTDADAPRLTAQSRGLQRTRKPRAIATASPTGRPPSREPPRHGSVPSATAAAPAPPPLHHCAGQHKTRSPACGLLAATASHPAPRQRRCHWLCPSCCRRPASAHFLPLLAGLVAYCPPPAPKAIKPPTASAATPAPRSQFAALNCTQPGRGKFAAARRALT